MRIGIDARLLTQTGVGVYTYNLLNFLPKYLPKDWEVFVFVRSEDKRNVPHQDRYKVIDSNFRWHTFSEQIGFLAQLLYYKLDLMHFTYFSFPLLYNRPFISTIHDLTPVLFKTGKASTKTTIEYYPKYFAMNKVITAAVRNSKAVITPTAFVKKQIEELYQVNGNKINPIYEGLNEKLTKAKENNELKKDFSKPFMMYLGNFYPHKNVETLVRSFEKIRNMNLVLIGPQDYFANHVQSLAKQLKLTNRIIFYHNPSLSDLVFFYKNAQALIHPSLSEGFGLTPLEAMFFGCPVIASNIEVFKETLGDDFVMFDPRNEESIAKAVTSVIHKKPKLNTRNILAKYSFETMAKETVELYKKVTRVTSGSS